MLRTNPVVVCRMLAGLRNRNYVTSRKGPGGGWTLSCSLDALTLLDVYLAVDEPPLFRIGAHAEHPECLVEQVVDALVEKTLTEAEELIRERLGEVTVGDLANDFDRRVLERD